MRQPILFCTVPNTSLVEKKNCPGLSLGACFLAGGLEHRGFPVAFYDLDMALNRMREESLILGPWDQKILTDVSALRAHISGENTSRILENWADLLVARIAPPHDFSCVALSLDRKEYASWNSLATLHFGLILASKFKRRFDCPVFMGGRQVLKQLGVSTVMNTLKQLPGNAVDLFFTRDGHTSFPEFLVRWSEGMALDSEEARAFAEKQSHFGKMAKIVPRYRIENESDSIFSIGKLTPEPLRARYPEVLDAEPILLAPYKFSIGCPFKCAFCSSGEDSYYGYLDVDDIVNTLTKLHEQGIKYFRWFNNNVNLSPKFVESLTGKIKESGIKILFSDSANMRTVSPQIFRQLAEVGCVKLWYGTETVSDRMLHMINKKVAFEKVLKALTWASDVGIWNSLNFIFNFPHETEDDFHQLLKFIGDREIVDTCQVNEFMLLGDTSYAKRPHEFGIEVKEISQSGIIGAYDEIGGLTWAEKQALGAKKKASLWQVRNEFENGITENDYLLFGLRNIGYDKKRVKEYFKDLLSYLISENQLADYWVRTTWRTSGERTIHLDNAIFGNVLRSSVEDQPQKEFISMKNQLAEN